jgi:hypothetical protein
MSKARQKVVIAIYDFVLCCELPVIMGVIAPKIDFKTINDK